MPLCHIDFLPLGDGQHIIDHHFFYKLKCFSLAGANSLAHGRYSDGHLPYLSHNTHSIINTGLAQSRWQCQKHLESAHVSVIILQLFIVTVLQLCYFCYIPMDFFNLGLLNQEVSTI